MGEKEIVADEFEQFFSDFVFLDSFEKKSFLSSFKFPRFSFGFLKKRV